MAGRNHRFGWRLLALILLALIPGTVIAVRGILQARAAEAGAYRENAEQRALLVGARFTILLRETKQLLRAAASHPDVISGRGCPQQLAQLADPDATYSALGTMEYPGHIRCLTVPWDRATPPDMSRFFPPADGFALSDALWSPVSRRLVSLASHPFTLRDGRRGAVAAGIDLVELASAQGRRLPDDAVLLVVKENGNVLLRYPEPARWIGLEAPVEWMTEVAGAAPHGTFEGAGLDGRRRLFGVAELHVDGFGAFAVVGLPLDGADDATRHIAISSILGIAVVALFAIGATITGAEVLVARPTRARLRALAQQLLQIQEAERRDLARELHDEMGQSLTALKLNLQQIRSTDERAGRLDEAIGLADRLLRQVRSLSLNLRPSMLDHLGLLPTLRWLLKREAALSGYHVELRVEPQNLRLPGDLETTLFRIAQEALTNVARHAGATEVMVALTRTRHGVRLSVEDNGRGFDRQTALRRSEQGRSAGLLGMEERARLAGGTLHIESSGDGTRVIVDVPLAEGEDGSA